MFNPERTMQEDPEPSVLSVRDQLNAIEGLVNLCVIVLSQHQLTGTHIEAIVANALCEFVCPAIKKAEEELARV